MESEKVTLKKTIKDMWNSFKIKSTFLKIKQQDTLPWTIIGKNIKLKKFEKMFNGYHVRYKFKFFRPLLVLATYMFAKLNKKVLGVSFVPTEKMSVEPCNKLINICNATLMQTLKESTLMLKKDVEGYHNPLKRIYNKLIKTMYDVVMQNILYDTYYRGVFEIFMFNSAINIANAYKDDNTHVMYNKKDLDNIDYLVAVGRNDSKNLVLNNENEIIVIPKGGAIRMIKRDVENLLKDLGEIEKNKKEKEFKTPQPKSS